MKLLLIKLFVSFVLFFCFSFGALTEELKALYKIELGTINIGSLNWVINLDDNNYKTSMSLIDKGFFAGLYEFNGKYFSEGRVIDNEFISFRYKQFWKTKKKKKEVEIFFDKMMVANLILDPKENKSPQVEYLKINGLIDPLASFLNILANGSNNFKTIDGRRLYKMSVSHIKSKENTILKKIEINDYFNIWADHKKRDLKYIITEQNLSKKNDFFPDNIKINNKRLVFNLTKI